MHIVYLDKKIILENIINDINLINIEDDIQYLNRNDGILIRGKINIECEYLSLGVIKYFKDFLDVYILIPYENIITNEVIFKLEDFDYYMKERELSLSFKVNIEGYQEIEKTFQEEDNKMEIVSNVDVELEDIEKYLGYDDDIVEIDEEEIPINKDEINKIEKLKINDEIIDNKNKKNNIEEEGRMLDFNIKGEEAIKYINTNKKVDSKSSFLNDIFKKDKKIKLYKYRIILENETYEEIAKENNINLFKLKELNNNKTLSLGQMIKIPNKNE